MFFYAACSQSYCSNDRCTGCFVFLVTLEQGKFASFTVITFIITCTAVWHDDVLKCSDNNFLPHLITFINFNEPSVALISYYNYMNMHTGVFASF